MDLYERLAKRELAAYPIDSYPDDCVKGLYRILTEAKLKNMEPLKQIKWEEYNEETEDTCCS